MDHATWTGLGGPAKTLQQVLGNATHWVQEDHVGGQNWAPELCWADWTGFGHSGCLERHSCLRCGRGGVGVFAQP